MSEEKIGHIIKIPLDEVTELVEAEPQVAYSEDEIANVLYDLHNAVDNGSYISPTPTKDNPALSDDYIFDTNDQNLILKDLSRENFVGKIKDLSKGAQKRKANGLPEEHLYVFKYACNLLLREVKINSVDNENILIYIKLNDRKTPYNRVFVISFHKNRPKK